MSRSDEIKEWIERRHYDCRASDSGADESTPGHSALRSSLKISAEFSPGPVFQKGLEQFTRFLRVCLGVECGEGEGSEVVFALQENSEPRGFRVEVAEGCIKISAKTERDLVDAMHYVEREMADAGRAELPLGVISRSPSLSTRFTEGIFVPGYQSAEEPGEFSDEYLGLMAHFGGNALKVKLNLHEIWKSESLPELNAAGAEASLVLLREHARRLADRGMDLFLVLDAPTLSATHPVFENHPEVAGAREEIFLEELSGGDQTVLCSGSPRVLDAYGEVIENLYRHIPELAGTIVLIGGEGFHHCFMRPKDPDQQATNCRHCAGQNPHERVANLVNVLTRATRRAGADKRLLAWSYSAFVWSREDPTDSGWVRHLEPGAEVLVNFDCGDVDPTTDAGVALFDYNIKQIGPSSRFRSQAEVCRERGIPILAKTETNTTPDTFFLPYLPVYFRWFERFKAIRESGAAGFKGQWRFYGMNGSPPEELQYHSVWNPERSAEEILSTMARRDFAIDGDAASAAVEAWRMLSEAWDDFPYSALTGGEREAYMRGPWYLGPAHPLIFNEQSLYDLGGQFFQRRGDLAEMMSAEEMAQLAGKPRYVCNLLFCLPFGVEKFMRLARECRDRWDLGVTRLAEAIGAEPNAEARREMNVCQTISIHLHTLINTTEFFRLRDRLGQEEMASPQFELIVADLKTVVEREIANARRALPIVREDPRIGFGYTYGEVYDADMIEQKIRQCEFVLSAELPRIASVIRFHVWNQFP